MLKILTIHIYDEIDGQERSEDWSKQKPVAPRQVMEIVGKCRPLKRHLQSALASRGRIATVHRTRSMKKDVNPRCVAKNKGDGDDDDDDDVDDDDGHDDEDDGHDHVMMSNDIQMTSKWRLNAV